MEREEDDNQRERKLSERAGWEQEARLELYLGVGRKLAKSRNQTRTVASTVGPRISGAKLENEYRVRENE